MREEIITSGRLNPNIDPYLQIWHWHIPLYLFLGGLAFLLAVVWGGPLIRLLRAKLKKCRQL